MSILNEPFRLCAIKKNGEINKAMDRISFFMTGWQVEQL
jgi:hypothetical protein